MNWCWKTFWWLDQEADTLLYAHFLKADIRTFALFRNRIELDGILLDKAKIDLVKPTPDGVFNHQFIFDHFANKDTTAVKKPKRKKRPLLLGLDILQLRETDFHLFNGGNGDNFDVFIPKGDISFRDIDLESPLIASSKLELDEPSIYFTKYKVDRPPDETPQVLPAVQIEQPDSTKKTIRFEVDAVRLKDAKFNMDNLRFEARNTTGIDFNRLAMKRINLEVDSFSFEEMEFIGDIKHLELKEDCGFVLDHLEGEALVNPTKVDMLNFHLQTPVTDVRDTLYFTYPEFPAFENFSKRVRMDLRIKEKSKIAVKDIMYFAPILEENDFFRERKEDLISISGRFTGRVNKLKGRNLFAQIGDRTYLKGEFDFQGYYDPFRYPMDH